MKNFVKIDVPVLKNEEGLLPKKKWKSRDLHFIVKVYKPCAIRAFHQLVL